MGAARNFLATSRGRPFAVVLVVLVCCAATASVGVAGQAAADNPGTDVATEAESDFVVDVGEDAVVRQSEQITLNLSATGQSLLPFFDRLSGYNLTVEYDEDVLSFDRVSAGDLGAVEVVDQRPGAVTLSSPSGETSTFTPLTLARLQFTVVGEEAATTGVSVADDATLLSRGVFGAFERSGSFQPAEVTVLSRDQRVVGFEATNTGGFLAFDRPTRASAAAAGRQFPTGSIQFNATVGPDGSWSTEAVDVPDLRVAGLPVETSVPDGFQGKIDPAEGRLTAGGELRVRFFNERFSFDVAATSEESGALSGDAVFGAANGTATLVDNEFTVTDRTGFRVVDLLLGVPSPESGSNWFELPLRVDLNTVERPSLPTEFAAVNTDGFLSFDSDTAQRARSDEDIDFDPGDVRIEATVSRDGTWNTTGLDFGSVDVVGLQTDIRAPDGLSGEVNVTGDRLSASGRLTLDVGGSEFGFNTSLTTDASGELTGNATLNETGGSAVLVDNEFVADEKTGDQVIDVSLGVPSPAGSNWFELPLELAYGLPEDTGSVVVRVTDQRDQPIENATVSIGDKQAETDADGSTRLRAPAGSQNVTVRADDEQKRFPVQVEGGSVQTVRADLPVIENGTLRVALNDSEGQPVTDASLSIFTESGIRPVLVTEPGDDGEVTISLEPGEYGVVIERNQVERLARVEVEANTVTTVSRELAPAGTLNLSVRREGTGESFKGYYYTNIRRPDGTPVTSTLYPDSNGVVTVDLAPGRYEVDTDLPEKDNSTYVEITPNETTRLVVTVPPKESLTVNVLNESTGEPAPGVSIGVAGSSQQTDETGQAIFELSEGSYEVTATIDGVSETREFTLGTGEQRTETIELQVPAVPTVGDEIPGSFELFDDLMLEYRREFEAPGAVLGVSLNGEPLAVRGYGWRDVNRTEEMTVNSTFRIASLSKRLTRAAAYQLVQESNVSYETKLFERLDLDPLGGEVADDRIYNITLRQALDHELGWDRDQSGDPVFDQRDIALELGLSEPPTAEQIVRRWMTVPLDFEPGTDTAYSNIGYSLVELLIEQESGQQFEAYLDEEVLDSARIENLYRGETFPEERPDREVEYDDDLLTPRVDVLDEVERVPYSDGGFEMSSVAAPAGYVSSAEAYLEFLSEYDITTGAPREGAVNQTDWQTGRITYGTLALTVQVDNPQLDIVAIFNSAKRGFDQEELTAILDRVADELGLEFGEPPVPTG